MLTVDEAAAAVLNAAFPLAAEAVPTHLALRRTLAETVCAPGDLPAFDKALMDGYAFRHADVATPETRLRVTETVTAGTVAAAAVQAGEAVRIMTGAPLPPGADSVIPHEQTQCDAAGEWMCVVQPVRRGANILWRGESVRAGEDVLAAGATLRPQDLGVLAELGRGAVPVIRRPVVSILATGDELVPPGEPVGPGQICNSNETLLCGLATAAGAEPRSLGIVRDDADALRAAIREGFEADVLILSGGVSAGLLDLVPAALADCGVTQVFHKVHLKPGKPIWFGTRIEGSRRTLVFGLPGNPVSVLVCFELFVRPALGKLLGCADVAPPWRTAVLAGDYENRGPRPTYAPVSLAIDETGRLTATAVPWVGSADLRATARADGVARFDPQTHTAAGQTVPVLLWSGGRL